ncbi:Hypothetical protein, putative [Bodo saltans]|uniref:Uncharacterized protein n=1 Tax=Bodo saltans TaxID=75058 RepID=A0A0S4JEU9_BODSA|nr:Hypothetical protein, putative [Bodo saltans]|eukprot:CUG88671.1 Hypothetical protein, putative [Bodo saltans]
MPAKTAKELLAERARIDAAMAQLESAKLKASAQRQEYGKFLAWKVDLQRKERKQREEESQQLRERVEKKLTEVLQEHREHKKRETRAYREFADSAVKKSRPLNISTSFDRENAILAEAQAEKERRRMEWQQFRSEMGLRSAPDRVPAGGGNSVSNAVSIQRSIQKQSAPGAFVSATPRAPPGNAPLGQSRQTIGSPNDYDEDGYDANLMKDKVGHVGGLVTTMQGGNEAKEEELSALRRSRLDAISATEKRQNAVHKRALLMENMFNKARTRRMYAQNRIAADPPADYLIGTDILRYIPVDLIPGGAQFGEEPTESPRKRGQMTASDGQAFFMTAVDSNQADTGLPSLSGAVPGDGGQERTISPKVQKRLKQRSKNFDAQLWHQQKVFSDAIPALRQERVLDEENAMFEWYQTAQGLSGRPSWKARASHTWSRREEAASPAAIMGGGPHAIRSIRLDPE